MNARLNYGAVALHGTKNMAMADAEAPAFAMPSVSEDAANELDHLATSLQNAAKHFTGRYGNDDAECGEAVEISRVAADMSSGAVGSGVKFAYDRVYQGLTMCDMGTLELHGAASTALPRRASRGGPESSRTTIGMTAGRY